MEFITKSAVAQRKEVQQCPPPRRGLLEIVSESLLGALGGGGLLYSAVNTPSSLAIGGIAGFLLILVPQLTMKANSSPKSR